MFFSSLNYRTSVDSYPSEPIKTGQVNCCWDMSLRKNVMYIPVSGCVTQVDPQRQRKPCGNGNYSMLLYLRVLPCSVPRKFFSSAQQIPTTRWIEDRVFKLEKRMIIEMATHTAHTQEVAKNTNCRREFAG